MNERDYTLLQYMALLTGLVLILTWISFSLAYGIALTYRDALFILVIGILSFGTSFVSYFKKQIYLAEMKNDLKRKE